MSSVHFAPVRRLRGVVTPPADKSISHRAALLGAMAVEPLRVRNYLVAEDTLSTLAAVAQLGALVTRDGTGVTIRGTGLRGASPCDETIDVGNAGTLMRLLPGWLAGQDGRSYRFDGDDSIRRRPIDRIAEPLRLMGAGIDATDGRLPPFTVTGSRLTAIDYELPVASAQVKSCVLLAGLTAKGITTVIEPEPSRDHTERMLVAAGVTVTRAGDRVSVTGADELALDHELVVPADPSSAAFWLAAASIVAGSRITVEGTTSNWTRTGFLRILDRMGGAVVGEFERPQRDGEVVAAEPIGPVDVASSPLTGTTVTADEVPLAIDELPLVALLGCFAEGETVVTGAEELRFKESDRIATVVDGLNGLGGDLEATGDGFVVRGTGGLRGGAIDSHGDHRLAMLGAIAGIASREGVTVNGMDAAAVSYPGFLDDLTTLTT
ncbi:MAG: 3-phosphoshikimate 1-carboxyvinyltransferase [Baekduia sp.]